VHVRFGNRKYKLFIIYIF